jgi:predicted SPOUT superfamily RNA methylase MTH1
LVVFGGSKQIEDVVSSEEALDSSEMTAYFNHVLNVVKGKGSRTIRTEEAILVGLGALRARTVNTIGG